MADKIVTIAAGHAGFGVTPGKRGPDGKVEWEWNNAVVLAAISHLKSFKGVTVVRVDDPTGGTDVSLNTRVARANAAGSDLHIDVHHNALGNKWFDGPGGVETFVMQGTSANAEAMKAAKEIHPRIVKAMGLRDRGLKQANFQILRMTKKPAVLTEGGFMDSRTDRKAMDDPTKIKAQGVALAEGAAAYLKLSIGAIAAAKPSTARDYLLLNDTGATVKTLQSNLSKVGYPLTVDGIYGKATQNAVKAFQLANGLVVDGVAGKATLSLLSARVLKLNKPAPKPTPKPKEEPKVADKNEIPAWAEKAWQHVEKKGYINDGRPQDNVTRAELAVIIARMEGVKV